MKYLEVVGIPAWLSLVEFVIEKYVQGASIITQKTPEGSGNLTYSCKRRQLTAFMHAVCIGPGMVYTRYAMDLWSICACFAQCFLTSLILLKGQ